MQLAAGQTVVRRLEINRPAACHALQFNPIRN